MGGLQHSPSPSKPGPQKPGFSMRLDKDGQNVHIRRSTTKKENPMLFDLMPEEIIAILRFLPPIHQRSFPTLHNLAKRLEIALARETERQRDFQTLAEFYGVEYEPPGAFEHYRQWTGE
jgi:hypothetical protein